MLTTPTLPTFAMATMAMLLLSGCTGGGAYDEALFGTHTGGTIDGSGIKQAGSSTVLPLAEVWAEEFGGARNVQIAVAGGGSGAGASGLCAKSLDLGDMSRRIKDSETATCRANGVEPIEWKIAYDALSVVVGTGNTFLQDLSVAQLKSVFQETGHATKWNEVDPSFPATDIHLCYPGSDSGTYEYFNEAILGSGKPRTGAGVQQSEDDNVLVNCLQADNNAIGYFGLAYLEENPTKVKAVKVNGVAPGKDAVVDGSYKPLSRFIYIYTNGVPKENLLADYLNYVLASDGGQRLVEDVGYVVLDPATQKAMQDQLGHS